MCAAEEGPQSPEKLASTRIDATSRSTVTRTNPVPSESFAGDSFAPESVVSYTTSCAAAGRDTAAASKAPQRAAATLMQQRGAAPRAARPRRAPPVQAPPARPPTGRTREPPPP